MFNLNFKNFFKKNTEDKKESSVSEDENQKIEAHQSAEDLNAGIDASQANGDNVEPLNSENQSLDSAEPLNTEISQEEEKDIRAYFEIIKPRIEEHNLKQTKSENLNSEDQVRLKEIDGQAQADLLAAKKKSLADLDKVEKMTFTAGAVDVTSIVKSRAYNAASESMTADKEELRGFGGFLKKIWRYNYFEQYYHQKAKVEAKKAILEKGSINANEDLSESAKKKADEDFSRSLLQRFMADEKDELVEKGLGEERKELKAETEQEIQVKADLKKIINDYADGTVNEAQFEEQKRQVLGGLDEYSKQNHKNGSGEKYEKTELYVDNFLDIARKVRDVKNNIRQAKDHQAKKAEFDFEINLVLGKAKEGVKTETHYNIVDKTIENIRRTSIGGLMNETVLAASVSLASSAASFVSQRLARSKALAYGTLGLSAAVSGLYSGLKENQMQKRDRQTLERRSAAGGLNNLSQAELTAKISALEEEKKNTTDKKAIKKIDKEVSALSAEKKKNKELEAYIYDKEKASRLSDDLSEAIYKDGPNGSRVKKDDSEIDKQGLLNVMADLEARLSLSNERKIDLISYSSLASVERERLILLVLKAEAKKRLVDLNSNDPDSFSKNLQQLTDVHRKRLIEGEGKDGGLSVKDREFAKHKSKAVFNKVVMSTVSGLTIGLVAQEASAFFTDKQEGLVENLIKGNNRVLGYHDTVLQNLLGHHSPGSLHHVPFGKGSITLPSNCDLITNPDGSLNLMRGQELLAAHLTLDGHGALTQEAKNILAGEGISLSDSQHIIDSGGTIETHSSPDDYVNKHPDQFTEISRARFNGNDTPMYMGEDGKLHGADLNEQRAHFAGDHGSGIDSGSNEYVMSAIKMRPDGSFQTVNGTKLSENAAELIRGGKMKFLFSLSAGTQHQVIEIPIDPKTGEIRVSRLSKLGKLLFGEKDGHAVLQARFAEVATTSGVDSNGIESVHLFATAEGPRVDDVISSEYVPPIINTNSVLGIPHGTSLPNFIPFVARTPLDKKRPKAVPEKKPAKKPPIAPIIPISPEKKVVETSYYGYGENLKKDKVDLREYSNIPKSNTSKGNKRGPLFVKNNDGNYGADIKLKKDNVNIKEFAGKLEVPVSLVEEILNNSKYEGYRHVIKNLDKYVNFDSLDIEEKNKIRKECDNYNRRYRDPKNKNTHINIEEYVGIQIGRLSSQIKNIFISEAKVGEKPFPAEFYEQSNLIKGVNRAEEIVIILDDPIGDAVLTIPAVLAVQRYLEENKQDKKIKLATNDIGMQLFKTLADQFPGKIELVNCGSRRGDKFAALKENFLGDNKEKFIINAHKEFDDYQMLNLSKEESADRSRVMSVDWSSWNKEEVPTKREGVLEKYDAIPARVMRNFEVMFGQKLFEDINNQEHFLEKAKDADAVSAELKDKYKIAQNQEVIVISAGSSVMPKEYEPEKWESAIRGILQEHPNSKVLFLQDPNLERQARYSSMIERLTNSSEDVSLVNEKVEKMNGIMSMADLVITPDTGLGRYAGALGKPNIMLILGDPVRWSTATTERIVHQKGRDTYAKNAGTYEKAWTLDSGYYVNDNEEIIGASNLSPDLIIKAADKFLDKKGKKKKKRKALVNTGK